MPAAAAAARREPETRLSALGGTWFSACCNTRHPSPNSVLNTQSTAELELKSLCAFLRARPRRRGDLPQDAMLASGELAGLLRAQVLQQLLFCQPKECIVPAGDVQGLR